MSCENLVCASCAGPVVEGRCGTCRASRLTVHSHPQMLPAAALLWACLLLTVLLVVVQAR